MICYDRDGQRRRCVYIELLMHLGGLLNTQEARVALGYRIERLLRFFPAKQPPTCVNNSISTYSHAAVDHLLSGADAVDKMIHFCVYCACVSQGHGFESRSSLNFFQVAFSTA